MQQIVAYPYLRLKMTTVEALLRRGRCEVAKTAAVLRTA